MLKEKVNTKELNEIIILEIVNQYSNHPTTAVKLDSRLFKMKLFMFLNSKNGYGYMYNILSHLLKYKNYNFKIEHLNVFSKHAVKINIDNKNSVIIHDKGNSSSNSNISYSLIQNDIVYDYNTIDDLIGTIVLEQLFDSNNINICDLLENLNDLLNLIDEFNK